MWARFWARACELSGRFSRRASPAKSPELSDMAHGALSTLRQKAVAVAPALVGLLAVAVVMGVAGVAMATEPPAPTLQTFDLEFDQIIDAMITRMTEYVVPLIMLALGLTAIGIFIGWLKGASHSR